MELVLRKGVQSCWNRKEPKSLPQAVATRLEFILYMKDYYGRMEHQECKKIYIYVYVQVLFSKVTLNLYLETIHQSFPLNYTSCFILCTGIPPL